jgi:hypothetical protein
MNMILMNNILECVHEKEPENVTCKEAIQNIDFANDGNAGQNLQRPGPTLPEISILLT